MTEEELRLIEATAKIVTSLVSRTGDGLVFVKEAILTVHSTLLSLAHTKEQEELKPAVSVARSITPDHITCLECGEQFATIKQHLRKTHNLTPDEYRLKWGLFSDYPMAAPNYSAKRSALAIERDLAGNMHAKRRLKHASEHLGPRSDNRDEGDGEST